MTSPGLIALIIGSSDPVLWMRRRHPQGSHVVEISPSKGISELFASPTTNTPIGLLGLLRNKSSAYENHMRILDGFDIADTEVVPAHLVCHSASVLLTPKAAQRGDRHIIVPGWKADDLFALGYCLASRKLIDGERVFGCEFTPGKEEQGVERKERESRQTSSESGEKVGEGEEYGSLSVFDTRVSVPAKFLRAMQHKQHVAGSCVRWFLMEFAHCLCTIDSLLAHSLDG